MCSKKNVEEEEEEEGEESVGFVGSFGVGFDKGR